MTIFQQNACKLPAIIVTLAAVALPAVVAAQQLPTASSRFDVVAIHENRSSDPGAGMSLRGGSLEVHDMRLNSLITSAYGVREVLIFGLPRWAQDARYDIRAKIVDYSDPNLRNRIDSRETRRALMADLLQQRFHLKLHAETRNVPVYDLVIAPGGPKFRESFPLHNEPHLDIRSSEYTATSTSMLGLTYFLEEIVERTVVDKTGLTDAYDLHLQWMPDSAAATPGDAFPSIFTAVQEQLGLKLQPSKGLAKTLFVDHVERPLQN